MTIERRVETLEWQNMWMRRVAVGAVACAAAVIVVLARQDQGVPEEITARTLRLVDEDGVTWLLAEQVDGISRMRILRKGGPEILQLLASQDRTGLHVLDEKPGAMVSLCKMWNGTASLWLGGRDRSGVSVKQPADDTFRIRIYDKGSDPLWQAPPALAPTRGRTTDD